MDSESLEELNLNYKEFGDLIENLDKKHHHLEAKAGQLAGAYVIFQAIMYMQVFLPSAAAAAALPQQGRRWISISMSALISIAFWITFATTVRDCIRTRGQQESTFEEQQRLYRKIYSIRTGRRESGGGGAAQRSLSKMFAFARCQRYAYVGALHSALFSFTVLVSYALLPVGPV